MDRNTSSKDVAVRRKKNYPGYQYRRRSKANYADQYSAELQHILGLTLKSNCAFACDPNTGLLAYPAGCVIVLHNPRNGKQLFIFNPGQKTITCLKFSRDGNFIVTGESGHQPCVRVFSVADRQQITSFLSHKFGVSCVEFSPNLKYVISIGFQHDNVINVWDWKKNVLAASNKVSTKVKSLAFSEDNNYFVTVGNRHVKFWYLEKATTPDNCTVPLKGRSAILETLRNHMFCDVVCGVGSDSELTFAITRSGLLCQFNAKRTVSRHVELKSGTGRTICIINDSLLCGCGNGSVCVFSTTSLDFVTEIFPPNNMCGQDILATAIDSNNMWLHCVFADHSLVIADIMDFCNVHINSVARFHNSCVWDVKILPPSDLLDSDSSNSFITCSNDGSVRIWSLNDQEYKLVKVIHLQSQSDSTKNLENLPKVEARSICVRHDGKHVAIGDRTGHIHVFDLETFERVAFIPTHDGDILCMDYSQSGMLASASRDRCVHTFSEGYTPTHTIADHSAAVTAVKFAEHDQKFRLMTCGSDKSLYFNAISSTSGKTEINREQHFVEKHSIGHMAIIDDSVIVACGSNLSEYDIFGARLKRTFRGNEVGSNILHVAVDVQGTLLATSCIDKNIYVLGFMTAECLCVINGHSEVAVSLAFDSESHLLSTSADSSIFVWSLHHRVAEEVRHLQSIANSASSNLSTPGSPDLNRTSYFASEETLNVEIIGDSVENTPRSVNGDAISALFGANMVSQDVSEITFDIAAGDNNANANQKVDESLLPTWVTKQFTPEEPVVAGGNRVSADLGKWGNRLEQDKICEEIGNLAQARDLCSVASSYDDESVVSEWKDDISVDENQPFPNDNKAHEESPQLANNINTKKVENSDISPQPLEPSHLHHPLNQTYSKNELPKNAQIQDENCKAPSQDSNISDIVESKQPSDNFETSPVLDKLLTKNPTEDLQDFEVPSLAHELLLAETNDSDDIPDFDALAQTLDENARISARISEGLEPVKLESTKIPDLSEVQSEYKPVECVEHVDIRKIMFGANQNGIQKAGETVNEARKTDPESIVDKLSPPKREIPEKPSESPNKKLEKVIPTPEFVSKSVFSVCPSPRGLPDPLGITTPESPSSSPLKQQEDTVPSLAEASQLVTEQNDVISPGQQENAKDVAPQVDVNGISSENPYQIDLISFQDNLATEPGSVPNSNVELKLNSKESQPNNDTSVKQQIPNDEEIKLHCNGFSEIGNADSSKGDEQSDLHPSTNPPSPEQINSASFQLVEDVLADVEDVSESSSDLSEEVGDLKVNDGSSSAENLRVHQEGDILTVTSVAKAGDDALESSNDLNCENQDLNGDSEHKNKDNDRKSETSYETVNLNPEKGTDAPTLPPPVKLKAPQTPTNTVAMPPAFAELLASLKRGKIGKNFRSPPKTLPVKLNYTHQERHRADDDEQDSDNDSANSASYHDNGAEKNNNNTHYYMSDHMNGHHVSDHMNGNHVSDDHDERDDSYTECEKASHDLMNQFNQAEAIYHKWKDEGIDENQYGMLKLAQTFKTIQSKIGNLKLAEIKLPLSSSLEDLDAGSPVISLLREYSDRLVDIVHHQVASGKVREGQSDTV